MTLRPRFLLVGVILGLTVLVVFDYFGFIWHNDPFAYFYPVRGLDVSHHQNNIDWPRVAQLRKFSFVFIKATEGHDFIDDKFATNWTQAQQNGLLVGAYHFFSTRSSGKDQAAFFIATVPLDNNALPPVIDIEIDLKKDPALIRQELTNLSQDLENYYHKKPILYVTQDTYLTYIKGYFVDNHLWVRDIIKPPYFADKNWLFWQYSNRGRVSGIGTYVDLNVFQGDLSDLRSL